MRTPDGVRRPCLPVLHPKNFFPRKMTYNKAAVIMEHGSRMRGDEHPACVYRQSASRLCLPDVDRHLGVGGGAGAPSCPLLACYVLRRGLRGCVVGEEKPRKLRNVGDGRMMWDSLEASDRRTEMGGSRHLFPWQMSCH